MKSLLAASETFTERLEKEEIYLSNRIIGISINKNMKYFWIDTTPGHTALTLVYFPHQIVIIRQVSTPLTYNFFLIYLFHVKVPENLLSTNV